LKISLYSLCAIFFPCLSWAEINQNGDFQIWNRNFAGVHLGKKWTFISQLEFRWGDDASTLYYTLLQPQLRYTPVPWLIIAPGYRQFWQRNLVKESLRPGYAPVLDISFLILMQDWQIRDRSGIEYIIHRSNPNHFLYRNRLRIIPPWSFTRFGINPFIEDEIFIRERVGFEQNRLLAGLFYLLQKNTSGELFYMLRYLKTGRSWTYQNVLGLVILFSF